MPYYVLIRIPQSRVDCCGGNTTRIEHLIKSILDLEPTLKGKVWGPCKNQNKLLQTKRIAPEGQRSTKLVNNTAVLRREHLNTTYIQKYPAMLLQDILNQSSNALMSLAEFRLIFNLNDVSTIPFEELHLFCRDVLLYNTDAVFIDGEWHTSKIISEKAIYDLDWNKQYLWKFLKYKPRDLMLVLEVSP